LGSVSNHDRSKECRHYILTVVTLDSSAGVYRAAEWAEWPKIPIDDCASTKQLTYDIQFSEVVLCVCEPIYCFIRR